MFRAVSLPAFRLSPSLPTYVTSVLSVSARPSAAWNHSSAAFRSCASKMDRPIRRPKGLRFSMLRIHQWQPSRTFEYLINLYVLFDPSGAALAISSHDSGTSSSRACATSIRECLTHVRGPTPSPHPCASSTCLPWLPLG